ncbi:MAG: NAD-dependent epimerase/dehydratase family protein [Chakrabartia sp.]
MTQKTLAITGATGFVGSHLIRLARAAGHPVRALTRRPQAPQPGLSWVAGALDDAASLDQLIAGAEAVIHVAGVVNAPDRAGFVAGNVTGTQAMVAAAQRAGGVRFIHVSSLAARLPDLSIYGWSKAEAEAQVAASGLDWTMVRPPWVYGPGDMDTLDMFRMAKSRLMLVPPEGAVSLIHAEDLSRLLLALVPSGAALGRILEADDGRPQGWTNRSVAHAIAAAMGTRALVLACPRPVLRLGAQFDRLFRGTKAKLTEDRVSYFCHKDWRIDPAQRPDPALWTPAIETQAGLRATAQSYRAAGLI